MEFQYAHRMYRMWFSRMDCFLMWRNFRYTFEYHTAAVWCLSTGKKLENVVCYQMGQLNNKLAVLY